jgi:6-phosphogluconolactonase
MAELPSLVCTGDAAASGAALVVEALRAVDSQRGRARLAIPGGSALGALRGVRAQLGAVWSRVRLTWVDERCVPLADAESNRGAAYRAGALDARDPPAELLPLFEDGERGEEAVARVEAWLDERFGGALDVVLLGMGEDGHVGSLFPAAPEPGSARVAFVRSSPKPPAQRITLTRRMLATAKRTILVATGEAKRLAVERVLAADVALPATGLPDLVVVTDLDLGARGTP